MKSDSYCECVCTCVGICNCTYGYIDVCLHKKCSPHLLEEDADDEEGVHAKHGEQVHPYVVLETSPDVSYKNGDNTEVRYDDTHPVLFLSDPSPIVGYACHSLTDSLAH